MEILNNQGIKKVLKVGKSRKHFLEFSILPKNERNMRKKYPEGSQNSFSSLLFVFWKN